MSEGADPSETLTTLRSGLQSVEETLKPLLDKPWTETTGSLSTLDRAKMDVLVSYAINDLIWVYLKMKGVDPSTHDVSGELERIRTYYGKVKAVEEPETRRTTQIDKAAASRLVTNSIPKRQRLPAQSQDSAGASASTSAAAIARAQAEAAVNEEEIGTSSRFRHIAKPDEVERIAVDSDHDSEEEEGGPGGDEAEYLLNDLQEQFQTSQAQGASEGEGDGDPKKRKRAEDLNR